MNTHPKDTLLTPSAQATIRAAVQLRAVGQTPDACELADVLYEPLAEAAFPLFEEYLALDPNGKETVEHVLAYFLMDLRSTWDIEV